jgi:rare lipoprotein A (peptidoglycan hydrolase)
MRMPTRAWITLAGLLIAAPLARADDRACTRQFGSPVDTRITSQAEPEPEPLPEESLFRYADLEADHRLSGLASYYSTFFDGRKTANGEIYRNRKFSAAHLTLPLGCWVEVTARATKKKLRLRVNDRGPYAKKFMLDLSQAAARFLGVDVAPDRYVDVRLIALPGEEPPPVIDVTAPAETIASATTEQ